jgi:hypothetical protein
MVIFIIIYLTTIVPLMIKQIYCIKQHFTIVKLLNNKNNHLVI